jgi:hypothetical protein
MAELGCFASRPLKNYVHNHTNQFEGQNKKGFQFKLTFSQEQFP